MPSYYECMGSLSTRKVVSVGSKTIVPLTTKPKRMTVAFATTAFTCENNKYINQ
jgi:hypothetical protein